MYCGAVSRLAYLIATADFALAYDPSATRAVLCLFASRCSAVSFESSLLSLCVSLFPSRAVAAASLLCTTDRCSRAPAAPVPASALRSHQCVASLRARSGRRPIHCWVLWSNGDEMHKGNRARSGVRFYPLLRSLADDLESAHGLHSEGDVLHCAAADPRRRIETGRSTQRAEHSPARASGTALHEPRVANSDCTLRSRSAPPTETAGRLVMIPAFCTRSSDAEEAAH